MRLLLLLDDEALRMSSCAFFQAQEWKVDATGDVNRAGTLLRKHAYDLVIADVPREESAKQAVLNFVRRPRRWKVRVLLTSMDDEVESGDDSLVVLTTPQPLDVVLGLASPAANP